MATTSRLRKTEMHWLQYVLLSVAVLHRGQNTRPHFVQTCATHIHWLRAISSRIPTTPSNQNTISRLFLSADGRNKCPAQSGCRMINAQRLVPVFTAQPLDPDGV